MKCWLCRRAVDDDYLLVRLADGRTARLCWKCREQGDIEVPMSYEEDTDDD